jgi:membrane protease YdiL (CAAX protease family)
MSIPRSVAAAPSDTDRSRPTDATGVDDYRPTVWHIWGVGFDSRIAELAGLSTLLLMISMNDLRIQGEYARFILEFVIPVAIVILLWRENPRRYGLRIGNWRMGLPISAAAIAIMAVVIWVVGRWPDFTAYYGSQSSGRPALRLAFDTGLDLLAWEFFFRGWLLWGLGRKFGSNAIWLQMVPFALMHVLKPPLEAISTVLGGAVFGILAWRTGSFLYGWLLHWFMVVWVVMVAGGYV